MTEKLLTFKVPVTRAAENIVLNFFIFHTLLHDNDEVLWFHTGCLCVCPAICHMYLHLSISISFLDNNLHNYQWSFTKFGICIDIVEIWFGIVNGQILSVFDRVICPPCVCILFPDNNLSKCRWNSTKLSLCIDMENLFGIAYGQYCQFLTELSAHNMIIVRYYHISHFYFQRRYPLIFNVICLPTKIFVTVCNNFVWGFKV